MCRFVDNGEFPETFNFKAKSMFVFEEIDGVDVCFFGMHVQEYGSECPFPNTRYNSNCIEYQFIMLQPRCLVISNESKL